MRVARALRVGFAGALWVVADCGGNQSGTTPPDASLAAEGAATEAGPIDEPAPTPVDASVIHCQLDDKTDPVALCTQKQALLALHTGAFRAGAGVAAGWDSATGRLDSDDSGAVLHDWRDDVGYAAAISLYLSSATLYGDTEANPALSADLLAVAPLIEQELAILPDEYAGEPYLRLRVAAGGARFVNDTSDGDRLDALADAYVRAIADNHVFALAPLPPPGGGPADAADVDGDAGASAADGAGSITDGPSSDSAGDAGLPMPGAIIGQPRGGAYVYTTADVATAALSLLDQAVRNPTDPDGVRWQVAAAGAFEHLYERARDPSTGLYYRALVTGGGPDHDDLDLTQSPADALLTEVTATVALALSRAADLVRSNASLLAAVAAYPFSDHVAQALFAVNGAPSLYDGPPRDAAATGTGFVEGYLPSSGTLITTKATRDNVYLLATLHRQRIMVATPWDTEILPMSATLLDRMPPNTSFLSVVPGQKAFLRAVSQDFGLIAARSDDPQPRSYQSAAVVAFVEGMTELLYGRP